MPYPPLRRNEVPLTEVDLDGEQSQYVVNMMNGLPYAEYTVEVFAYNVKRGRTVSSPVQMTGRRTVPIG